MDKLKKARLIRRLKEKGMPSYDKPLPIVELEDFFDGNDDNDSIGVNTA